MPGPVMWGLSMHKGSLNSVRVLVCRGFTRKRRTGEIPCWPKRPRPGQCCDATAGRSGGLVLQGSVDRPSGPLILGDQAVTQVTVPFGRASLPGVTEGGIRMLL